MSLPHECSVDRSLAFLISEESENLCPCAPVCVCVVCVHVCMRKEEGSAHLPRVRAEALRGLRQKQAASHEDTKKEFFPTLNLLEPNRSHLSEGGSDTIRC